MSTQAVITGVKAQAYINARHERENLHGWWDRGARVYEIPQPPAARQKPGKIITTVTVGRPPDAFGCAQMARLFGITQRKASRHLDELRRLPYMMREARRLTVRMIITGK